MKTITDINEMQSLAEAGRMAGMRIALVPTMGYLHQGHLTLMEYGRGKAGLLVISIFVNPLQFGPGEDFEKYPRDPERDARLAEEAGVDLIFSPAARDLYPDHFQTYVEVKKITQNLCGASRPGHFQGVTTVVCKLFQIVKPHLAIFGQKDFQQLAVIRQMVRDLNMDLEVVGRPTVRESDGLALSSRNVYLSTDERVSARSLSGALQEAQTLYRGGERHSEVILDRVREIILGADRTRIDYVKICHPETLEDIPLITDRAVLALAVWIGKTRLIDNCLLEE